MVSRDTKPRFAKSARREEVATECMNPLTIPQDYTERPMKPLLTAGMRRQPAHTSA